MKRSFFLVFLSLGLGGSFSQADPDEPNFDPEPETKPPVIRAIPMNIIKAKEDVLVIPELEEGEDDRIHKVRQAVFDVVPPERHYRIQLADLCGELYSTAEFDNLWKKQAEDSLTGVLADLLKANGLPTGFALSAEGIEDELGRSPVKKSDLAKSIAILDTALAIRLGAVDPEDLWGNWNKGDAPGMESDSPEALAKEFRSQLESNESSVEKIVTGFIPKNWVYKALLEQYHKTTAELAKDSELPELPSPSEAGLAKPGKAYKHAPALAAQLKDKGYLEEDSEIKIDELTSITDELTEAIKAFQKDNNLNADGIVGTATWKVLNRNAAKDLEAIALNLQRARMLPSDLGERYVIVNLPAAELYAFEDSGKHALSMRVVCGKSGRADQHTPVFRDVIQEVVFRPYWNVPNSIARNELVPRIRKDSSYLTRNNYEITGGTSKTYPATSANLDKVEKQILYIRQKPGDKNALGKVKFLLPNQFNVYLHDTPSRHLFANTKRDYSHGCVRLQHPQDFAAWVLKPQGISEETVKKLINIGNRTDKHVESPVNVYITYFTAFPRPTGENGELQLSVYNDLYKRDQTAWHVVASTTQRALAGSKN